MLHIALSGEGAQEAKSLLQIRLDVLYWFCRRSLAIEHTEQRPREDMLFFSSHEIQ